MTATNGVATQEDWVLAFVAGIRLVGRRSAPIGWTAGVHAPSRLLGPVYELQTQVVQARGPDGKPVPMIAHGCVPVMLLQSLSSIELPEHGAVVVPVASLSKEEQKIVMDAIKTGEDLVRQLRASQTGIALPTAADVAAVVGGRS